MGALTELLHTTTVSLGVLWWIGSVIIGAAIGTMCGLAAAFAVNALYAVAKRAGERL